MCKLTTAYEGIDSRVHILDFAFHSVFLNILFCLWIDIADEVLFGSTLVLTLIQRVYGSVGFVASIDKSLLH